MGRAQLGKESNIVEIIQNQRYFTAALSRLLSREEEGKLRKESQSKVICIDDYPNVNGEAQGSNGGSSSQIDLEFPHRGLDLSQCSEIQFKADRSDIYLLKEGEFKSAPIKQTNIILDFDPKT